MPTKQKIIILICSLLFTPAISFSQSVDPSSVQKTMDMIKTLNEKKCEACLLFSTEGHDIYSENSKYKYPESAKECSLNRKYLSESISNFKENDPTDSYVTSRPMINNMNFLVSQNNPDIIPKACITYAMRTFLKEKNPSDETDSYAQCDGHHQLPRQGMPKPCVSEDYTNLVYNSFVDVTDCLGLDAKMIIPKLMNESGFHINAFNALKVYDTETNKSRYLPDLRVCNTATEKIDDISKLRKCSDEQIKKFWDGEEAILKENKIEESDTDEVKKIKKAKISDWRKKNSILIRDIFDFKSAPDSFHDDLVSKVQDPDFCKDYLIEKFCDHKTRIIGGDAGINQFTNDAVEESAKKIDKIYSQINQNKSVKESCRRLRKFIASDSSLIKQNDPNLKARCRYISTPPNPILSLIGYASFYQAQKESVESILNKKIAQPVSAKTKEALTILSYNTGPTAAVTYYRSWLKFKDTSGVSGNFIDYMDKNNHQMYLKYILQNAEILDKEIGLNQCTQKNFLKSIQ